MAKHRMLVAIALFLTMIIAVGCDHFVVRDDVVVTPKTFSRIVSDLEKVGWTPGTCRSSPAHSTPVKDGELYCAFKNFDVACDTPLGFKTTCERKVTASLSLARGEVTYSIFAVGGFPTAPYEKAGDSAKAEIDAIVKR